MNKPSSKNFNTLLIASAILHVIILFAWLNSNNSIKNDIAVSKSFDVIVITKKTLNQNINVASTKLVTKNLSQTEPLIKEVQLEESNDILTKENVSKHQIQAVPQKSGKEKNVLNTLLYSAINANKHYPVSALRLQREGTVSIVFKLMNSGEINTLGVSRSSGYNSLDHAALIAVKRIQPFHPAKEYISNAQQFNVDVVFQL